MGTVRKNGKAYDSADVVVTMLGSSDAEIDSISYSTEREHQLNFSLGSRTAKTWSMGKDTPECTIGIYMTTVVQFEKLAKGGSLMDIKPFDIQVTFTNEFNEIINDTVRVKFQNEGRDITGEMGLKRSYKMFCLGVNLNNNNTIL